MSGKRTDCKNEQKPRRRPQRRTFSITGTVVAPGALSPNENHPSRNSFTRNRREAFLDELSLALSELERQQTSEEDESSSKSGCLEVPETVALSS